MDDISETAQALGELVSALPPAEAAEVARVLGDSVERKLGVPERLAALELLIRLADDSGRYPDAEEYDAARERAAREGRQYASRRAISETYGGYRAAVTAAYELYCYGGNLGARKPRKGQPRSPKDAPYSASEILRAIAYFRARFGVFPRPTEYKQWRDLERRSARAKGRPRPRLPTLTQIATGFLPFDQAVIHAAEKWNTGTIEPVVEGMPAISAP